MIDLQLNKELIEKECGIKIRWCFTDCIEFSANAYPDISFVYNIVEYNAKYTLDDIISDIQHIVYMRIGFKRDFINNKMFYILNLIVITILALLIFYVNYKRFL